uniref:Uncharacterized protein n=1 Tax=Arion vulgaris TaxID=1028688 RepID=A0A0B6ZGQ1_9EUPU
MARCTLEHYACRSGHHLTCKTLLAYHADVNATTQSSKATPLHRAAYMGHSEIVSLLLDYKADPTCLDCDGMIPLHKAAQNGHIETIQILLRASPESADIKDNKSRKPIDLVQSQAVRTEFLH